jgi:GT2 family glycosyltransferase
MGNKQPLVSVIIPVFNDKDRLVACLEALRDQTYPRDLIKIVAVDNNSSENIMEAVSRFKNVTYAKEPARGPAAARNKGISVSRGEILAFTDADCMPCPEWVDAGVKVLTGTPGCGLVGGEVELYYRDKYRPTPVELYDTISYLTQRKYIEKFGFAATANMFTYRRVTEDVGVFLSEVFRDAAGEDAEWGRRVFNAGYIQAYAEKAVVRHPAESSLGGLLRKTIRIARGNHTMGRLVDDLDSIKKILRKTGRTIAVWFGVFPDIFKRGKINGAYNKGCVTLIAILILTVKILFKTWFFIQDLFRRKGHFFSSGARP